MERFSQDLYVRTQSDLVSLKSRLPSDSVALLAREVIRRLAERGPIESKTPTFPSAEELDQLARALIDDNPEAGANHIKEIRAEGASVEAVYLGYLAGAARMLGTWWDEDEVSFYEVTIGTSRMYAIMRSLQPLFVPAETDSSKFAVFASVPDETHTLGIHMAADIFRKEGWDIDLKVGHTHDELVEQIELAKPRILGLSAAGGHSIDALARLVLSVRIVSPTTQIMVSGKIVEESEELVSALSVDAMVADAKAAKTAMNQFVEQFVNA